MAMIVRLVRGEWKEDENGCFEHVAAIDCFSLAVRLREQDDFKTVVKAVKDRLCLGEEDDIELTYQWPQWMMGPDWKRANPIYIENDEDTSLFMAIRADLEEVHLRVKVFRGGKEKNDEVCQSAKISEDVTAKAISDKYWNMAETRAVWDSALTSLLARNDMAFYDMLNHADSVLQGSLQIRQGQNREGGIDDSLAKYHISEGPPRTEPYGGIRIFDDVARSIGDTIPVTPAKIANSGRVVPITTQRASASDKGKEKMVYDQNMNSPEFNVWRKSYVSEMWREMCATEMRLGSAQSGSNAVPPDSTTARTLNFNPPSVERQISEENLRLTLSGSVPTKETPPILTLSSDGTISVPASSDGSSSMSISTGEDSDTSNSYYDIGRREEMLPSYYSDEAGPLQITPTQKSPLPGVKNNSVATGGPNMEKGSGSKQQRVWFNNEVNVVDTPVPTVLRDRDAPPYVDDPGEEDYLHRALKDVYYEGDEIFVGRMFKSKEDCATKLAIHAINRKFHFIRAKSRPDILIAVCVSNTCPWRVYATKLEDSERFEVRTICPQHTCSVDARGDFHKQASTAVIGKLMRTLYVGVGRGPRPNELRQMLRQEFSLNVSYWKAWRAREIAMDNAMGSAMGSYALIQPYFKLLLETNPNSLVSLETEPGSLGVERFKYLFFALSASIEGYAYMRKVVVIDGTHLKGRYGGCLIAASAQDANFQIFPIAFGIVNSENDDAWEWFLRKLTAAIPDDPELVFVSDRHSSIYTSIRKVYPMSFHGACIVHLKRNIVSIFKSDELSRLVSAAARAYRLRDFNKLFNEIRAMNGACADYLAGIGFEHWTRSHFVANRYNVMTSNIAESLNNVLVMAREYPVISILETIRTTLVTWFALRRDAAQHEEHILPPKVHDMVYENFEKGAGYRVLKIGDGQYEVRDSYESGFAVNLWERTCTCREFQVLTIPCAHAIAAAIQEGVQVDTLVAVHHTVPQLRLAYKGMIMPVPDMASLTPSANDIGGGKLAPPYVRRPPGRPRKSRIFSKGEFKTKNRKRCTRCRTLGHNRTTCIAPITGLEGGF